MDLQFWCYTLMWYEMTHGHVWMPWWWCVQHSPRFNLFFFPLLYQCSQWQQQDWRTVLPLSYHKRLFLCVDVLSLNLPWKPIPPTRHRSSKSITTKSIHDLIPTEVIVAYWGEVNHGSYESGSIRRGWGWDRNIPWTPTLNMQQLLQWGSDRGLTWWEWIWSYDDV